MAENEKKNSLVELTKGFIALLATSGGGEIDLSDAEKTLQTQKRRLYDVANVLAGVGLVEKCGKSKVKWTGAMDGIAPMTNDVSLTEREQTIDEMIQIVSKCQSSAILTKLGEAMEEEKMLIRPDFSYH